MERHKHIWVMNKEDKLVCGVCGKAYEAKQKKSYKPRTTAYITDEKVQEIIASERKAQNTRQAACIETIYNLATRASEVIGKHGFYKERPGIRPIDIDAELHPEWGCEHTIRIWRKRGKFEIMPLTWKLFDLLTEQIKLWKVKPEERIFPYHRTTVYGWLRKYGFCVDSRYPIGIHTLRRSLGKEYRRRGGEIEKLQKLYSHENMAQTMKYIGEVKDEAMKEYSDLFDTKRPDVKKKKKEPKEDEEEAGE